MAIKHHIRKFRPYYQFKEYKICGSAYHGIPFEIRPICNTGLRRQQWRAANIAAGGIRETRGKVEFSVVKFWHWCSHLLYIGHNHITRKRKRKHGDGRQSIPGAEALNGMFTADFLIQKWLRHLRKRALIRKWLRHLWKSALVEEAEVQEDSEIQPSELRLVAVRCSHTRLLP